jgi:hypothetical protein
VYQASNAYWNFAYYDPNRLTITKPLMALSGYQLRQELALLAYLAIATNRALIVPNVLVGVGVGVPGQLSGGSLECREMPYQRSAYCKEIGDYRNTLVDTHPTTFAPMNRYDMELYFLVIVSITCVRLGDVRSTGVP